MGFGDCSAILPSLPLSTVILAHLHANHYSHHGIFAIPCAGLLRLLALLLFLLLFDIFFECFGQRLNFFSARVNTDTNKYSTALLEWLCVCVCARCIVCVVMVVCMRNIKEYMVANAAFSLSLSLYVFISCPCFIAIFHVFTSFQFSSFGFSIYYIYKMYIHSPYTIYSPSCLLAYAIL